MATFIPVRLVRYSIWALWILILMSALSWVLIGSVAYWVRSGWLPSDSAGWAQAIGAFIAIVVAIALPYFQSRQQQIEKTDAAINNRLEAINATYALMSHIQDLYKKLLIYTKPDENTFRVNSSLRVEGDPFTHELTQAAAMVREIPVVAISNQMVHFMIGIREVANFGEFVGGVFGHPLLDRTQSYNIRLKVRANMELIDRWLEELELLESEVRKMA